jgi:hypothetical protein
MHDETLVKATPRAKRRWPALEDFMRRLKTVGAPRAVKPACAPSKNPDLIGQSAFPEINFE